MSEMQSMANTAQHTTQLTPQERLALSRRAIVLHMHRNDHHRPELPRREDDAGQAFGDEPSSTPSSTWALVKNTVMSWWDHHPAHVAVDIAAPLISRYGGANPVKLLGISAGVGAAAVLLKPWRLISVGGILLAMMKSADISGALLSMMSRTNRRAAEPQQLQESH